MPTPRPAPVLPRDATDPTERARRVARMRDVYRDVADWPPGTTTAGWLPPGQDFDADFVSHVAPTYAALFANFACMAVHALEAGHVRQLRNTLSTLMATDTTVLRHNMLHAFREPAEAVVSAPRPKDLAAYHDVFCTWRRPDVVALVDDDRRRDDAIAWQRVAGVNPMVIARVRAWPDKLQVPRGAVRAVLGMGRDAAIGEGRLYVADYAALDGVACGVTDDTQKAVPAPIGLFGVDEAGDLRCIAIQVGQDPSAVATFTPADSWRWRMAVQCLQSADANDHEGRVHLGRCHLVLEAATIAMHRSFAPEHPLALLLRPHTDGTLAIDHAAKDSLIAPYGTVDDVFAPTIRGFVDFVHAQVSTWTWRDALPATELAARGVDDPVALPVYPYRDDGLPLFGALWSWVSDYVGLYYRSDADVADDPELAAFAAELSSPDGGRLGEQGPVATVDDLVGLFSALIWTATAQHSAVNFPQFRFMAYAPNMSGALWAPPPTPDTPNTEARYTAMLPPQRIVNVGAAMVYLLSNVRASRLGTYTPGTFVDPRVTAPLLRLQDRLRVLETQAVARDRGRMLSYPYLRPSMVLQSISI